MPVISAITAPAQARTTRAGDASATLKDTLSNFLRSHWGNKLDVGARGEEAVCFDFLSQGGKVNGLNAGDIA